MRGEYPLRRLSSRTTFFKTYCKSFMHVNCLFFANLF